MTLKRSWATTAAIAGVLAVTACQQKETPEAVVAVPGSEAACAAARAFVVQRLAKLEGKSQIEVSSGPLDTGFLAGSTAADLTARQTADSFFGWARNPPDPALVQKLLDSPPPNTVAVCADMAGAVEAAKVRLVSGEHKPPKDTLKMTWSLPLISDDGKDALLIESGHDKDDGGADVLVHLVKDDAGAWSEADTLAFIAGLDIPEIPDTPPAPPPIVTR